MRGLRDAVRVADGSDVASGDVSENLYEPLRSCASGDLVETHLSGRVIYERYPYGVSETLYGRGPCSGAVSEAETLHGRSQRPCTGGASRCSVRVACERRPCGVSETLYRRAESRRPCTGGPVSSG